MSKSKSKVGKGGDEAISEDYLLETIEKQDEMSQNLASMIASNLTVGGEKPSKTKPSHGMES